MTSLRCFEWRLARSKARAISKASLSSEVAKSFAVLEIQLFEHQTRRKVMLIDGASD